MADILLTNEKGYYDFKIENGDFVSTTGFETALILSIFTDRRANAGEVVNIELRRGWWGNLILRNLINKPTFEIGSKIWLTYQSRITQNILNAIKNYIDESLFWLIEDGHATNIKTTIKQESSNKISIQIFLEFNNNLLLRSVFELGALGKAS